MSDGGSDAEALGSAHAAARVRAENGDLTGARTMLEEALATGELRLGREDPRLAPLMVDLATLARKLGNLTEARNQLRRAYAIIVAAVGPDDATSLSVEGRLAAVIYRLGEPTEAYDWHLADAGRRVLGTDHPAVRGAQQRLAASSRGEAPQAQPPPPVLGWTDQAADAALRAPAEAPVPAVTYEPVAYEPVGYESAGWAASTEPEYVPVAPGVYGRPAQPARELAPAAEAWPDPVEELDAPRQRGHGGGVALVVSLGVVILVAAAVIGVQFIRSGVGPVAAPQTSATGTTVQGAEPPTPTPTPTAPPPTGLKLADQGGSVTLTWEDPSGGRISFIVSGGRDGETLTALNTVDPGKTSFTMYGLNLTYNYCFTVAAVWASDKITPSIRTCTTRSSTGASPSLAPARIDAYDEARLVGAAR